MIHEFRLRNAASTLAFLAFAFLLGLVVSAPAKAATASLVKAGGKPTLALVGEQKEANSINLRMISKTEFILQDNGEMPNFSDVVIGFSGDSLPGCHLENPYAALDNPGDLQVRCRISAVKQILLDLRDRDDYVSIGDGYRKWTEVPLPVFARTGEGNDQFTGGPRRDVVQLGPGRDIAEGRQGNDSIAGGPGSDSISGDASYTADRPPRKGGRDVLAGGSGNDYIAPGSGRDTVKGGPGRDIVYSVGDRDRDYVDCGAGRRDSLLGVDHRGIRFREKAVFGCETVGSGLFGGITWSCLKRRCAANLTPYAGRLRGHR